MPITLPPIRRRDFLRTSLACAASSLVLPFVAQGANENSLDTWAFVSDTHIPGDRKRNGGKENINPVQHLELARTDILSSEAGKVGGVIVCGDCAYMAGQPDDYKTLLDEFIPFPKADLPVHFVMGNHDNRKAFLEAVAKEVGKEPKAIPDKLHSIVETPKANFFLLDSSSRELGKEQRAWLADNLDSHKDKPAVLVAHHYLNYLEGTAENPHALADTAEFLEVIKPRKQVKAFVFGHSHRWQLLQQDGIHLINIPATAWRFEKPQPYGWVLATFQENAIQLTLRSLDKQHRKHNETKTLNWR
jgi:3',5'-cyclic AMP phosphodiesterase CpdA